MEFSGYLRNVKREKLSPTSRSSICNQQMCEKQAYQRSQTPIFVSEFNSMDATDKDQEIQKLRMKLRDEERKSAQVAQIMVEKDLAIRDAIEGKEKEIMKRIEAEEKLLKLKQSTQAVYREFNGLIKELWSHFQNCCTNNERSEVLKIIFQSQLDVVSKSVENKFQIAVENQQKMMRNVDELNEKVAQMNSASNVQILASSTQTKVSDEDMEGNCENSQPEKTTDLNEETILLEGRTLESCWSQSSFSDMERVVSVEELTPSANIAESLSLAQVKSPPILITLSDEEDDEIFTASSSQVASAAFGLQGSIKIEQEQEELPCADPPESKQSERGNFELGRAAEVNKESFVSEEMIMEISDNQSPVLGQVASMQEANNINDGEIMTNESGTISTFEMENTEESEQPGVLDCSVAVEQTSAAEPVQAQNKSPLGSQIALSLLASPCIGNIDGHSQPEKHEMSTAKYSPKKKAWVHCCTCGFQNTVKTNVIKHIKKYTREDCNSIVPNGGKPLSINENSENGLNVRFSARLKKQPSASPTAPASIDKEGNPKADHGGKRVVNVKNYKILNDGGLSSPLSQLNSKRASRGKHENHAEVTQDSDANKDVFTCTCGYLCSRRWNLIYHIRILTDEGRFQCEYCQKKFLYLSMLKRHKTSTHKVTDEDKTSRGCVECGKICPNLSDLMKHQKMEHANVSSFEFEQDCSLQEEEISKEEATINNSAASPVVNVPMSAIARSFLCESPKHHSFPLASPFQDYPTVEVAKSNAKSTSKYFHRNVENASTGRIYSRNKTVKVHFADTKLPGFVCSCRFKTHSEASLRYHIVRMNIGKNFQCTRCPRRFYSLYDRKKHTTRIHKIIDSKPTFGCQKCGMDFQTKLQRQEHQRTAHERTRESRRKSNETENIPAIVNSTQNLAKTSKFKVKSNMPLSSSRHQVDQFLKENEHGCTCGKRYLTKFNLANHIRLSNQDVTFRCDLCNKTFRYYSNLQQHAEICRRRKLALTNRKKNAIGCGDCGEIFTTHNQLDVHRKKFHCTPLEPMKRDNIVDRRFKTLKSFFLPSGNQIGKVRMFSNQIPHASVFTPSKEHKLDKSARKNVHRCTCGKVFKWRENLWSHIQFETREKKFHCVECKKKRSFLFFSELRRHMKIHKKEWDSRMTGCGKCGEVFQDRGEFERHKIANHFREPLQT